jgi:hypothetical protein
MVMRISRCPSRPQDACQVLGWRAACLQRGGNPPALAFPRRGKRERGRSNSSWPLQANLFTQPASRDPAAALRCVPWVAARANCRGPPGHFMRPKPYCHGAILKLIHSDVTTRQLYSASGSFRFARCGSSAMVLSGWTCRWCWMENTHVRSLRCVRTSAVPLPAAATANRRLHSARYSWPRNWFAFSTVAIWRNRNSYGSRPCLVR